MRNTYIYIYVTVMIVMIIIIMRPNILEDNIISEKTYIYIYIWLRSFIVHIFQSRQEVHVQYV